VRISQITGVDLAINYWGSPWIAHPIASFQFMDGPLLSPKASGVGCKRSLRRLHLNSDGLVAQW
jgi:hypothetical protein